MKLFSKILTVLTVVAMLVTCVGAAEFTASAERKDGPTLTGGDEVIITPVSKKDDPTTPDKTREDLNGVLDNLKENDLTDLTGSFDDAWDDKSGGAPIENAVVSDIFHVDFTKDDVTFSYTLPGIADDDFVLLVKNHVTGAWSVLDYTFANGAATVSLTDVSTIVVVRDNGNPPAGDIVSPPTGVSAVSVVLASATVALMGVAVLLSKKLRAGA